MPMSSLATCESTARPSTSTRAMESSRVVGWGADCCFPERQSWRGWHGKPRHSTREWCHESIPRETLSENFAANAGILPGFAVYDWPMQSAVGWKGDVAMSVYRDGKRWRYRTKFSVK